jgi:hypothetical protein
MGIRAFLARHCAHRCGHGHWIVRRLARTLKLDAAQQGRLRHVQEVVQQLRVDAQAGWTYRRDGLLGLLSGERLDRDEALRLARVPSAMENDALPKLIDVFGDFFDQLDATQRTRLRELAACRLGPRCGAP